LNHVDGQHVTRHDHACRALYPPRTVSVNFYIEGIMIAVILTNVVFIVLVVGGIVGSLAYSIVGSAPMRICRRTVRDVRSRLSAVPRLRQSTAR
jgi:hypothetical protein